MIDIDVSKIVSEIGEPKARIIENEDDKRQRQMAFICAVVFLFLFLGGTIFFMILNARASNKLSLLNKDVKSLEEAGANLLQYESDANEIVKRNQSINKILDNSASWKYVFERLQFVVPKGIVFSRFAVTSQDSMQIQGVGPDYIELSKFIVAMKDSGYFKNVVMANASLSTRDEQSSISFTINFGFANGISRSALREQKSAETTQVDTTATDNAGTIKMPGESVGSEAVENTTLPADNTALPTQESPAPTNTENNGAIPTL